MDQLIDGLIWYCALIPIVAIHEFGHAWMAVKCGDPTPRQMGRVTLNPVVHMDPIGTVAVPLIMVVLGAITPGLAGFIIGWGRPVMFDPGNCNNPKRDSVLVAMAGPLMNLVLAFIAVVGLRLVIPIDNEVLTDTFQILAQFSLFLMFFNLLPIPPLDGSYVMKYVTGMSEELYNNIANFGIIILIICLQMPVVQGFLGAATTNTFQVLLKIVFVGV